MQVFSDNKELKNVRIYFSRQVGKLTSSTAETKVEIGIIQKEMDDQSLERTPLTQKQVEDQVNAHFPLIGPKLIRLPRKTFLPLTPATPNKSTQRRLSDSPLEHHEPHRAPRNGIYFVQFYKNPNLLKTRYLKLFVMTPNACIFGAVRAVRRRNW